MKKLSMWARERASVLRMCIYVVLALLVSVYFLRQPLTRVGEEVLFAIRPSAELAVLIADRHFEAVDTDNYDVELAERFFERAAKIDPAHPYVYHQLARISFLKGDFDLALAQIDFQISMHGEKEIHSYYIRGLIEGFKGDYANAARDYEVYLKHDPTNWAATNDYAWVLLKDGRPKEALAAIEKVLPSWPDNPWLLNSKATALYEMGRYAEALTAVRSAKTALVHVTPTDWSRAYPGNDPRIAVEGLVAFMEGVEENMHMIEIASQKKTVE